MVISIKKVVFCKLYCFVLFAPYLECANLSADTETEYER